MGGVDRDRDIVGFEQGLQGDQYLLRQAFLHLRTLREETHDAVDLGQADDFILRDVSHLCGTVDRDEMMFTSAGDADVADLDHFLDTHLVIDYGDLREIEVVESGKHFVDVHLGNPVRCFAQAVVAQIQSQRLSDVGKRFFDAFVFFVTLVLMREQRSLESTLEQGMTYLVSLFGIGRRKFCRGLSKIAFHGLSFWSLRYRENEFLYAAPDQPTCARWRPPSSAMVLPVR